MKRLLRLSLPIMLASVVGAINHLTDRYFLGQSGETALSAVTQSGMLASLLTALFATSLGYVETFIAHRDAAGRDDESCRAFFQTVYLVLASVPLFILACPVGLVILDLVGHEEAIRAAEKTYFLFIQPGGILIVLSTVLGAFFTGQGKTRLFAVCSTAGLLSNILFDRILILGWGPIAPHGIAGAGLATVLANTIPCLLLTVAALRNPIISQSRSERRFAIRPKLMRDILRYGLPNGLNALLGATSFTVFAMVLGGLAQTDIAVSTAAFALNNVFVLAETALAQAITIAAGRTYGKEGASGIAAVTKSGFALAMIFAGLFLAVILPFSKSWLVLFTDSATDSSAFIRLGLALMPVLAVRTIADAVLTVFTGVLRGLGDTRFLVIVRTAADFAVWIPLIFLVKRFHPTLNAYWVTMPVSIGLSALLLWWRYRNFDRIRILPSES